MKEWKLVGDTVRELPDVDHGLFSFIGSDIIIHQVNTPNEKAEANAKLIAAALDLLEALKIAHQYMQVFLIRGEEPLVGENLKTDSYTVLEAIKKATL